MLWGRLLMSLILWNWNQAQRGEATCSTSYSKEWWEWRATIVYLVLRSMLWCYTVSFYRRENWGLEKGWKTYMKVPGFEPKAVWLQSQCSHCSFLQRKEPRGADASSLLSVSNADESDTTAKALRASIVSECLQVPPPFGAPMRAEAADKFIIIGGGRAWCLWKCLVNCNYIGNNNNQ